MIRNQRQYRITRSRVADFQEDVDRLQREAESGDTMAAVMAQAAEAQLADLMAELHNYEQLQAANNSVLTLRSLVDLPEALIRARISAGLTQRELAKRLNLKSQQVQRYEDGGYRNASLARLLNAAKALGVEIRDAKLIALESVSVPTLLRRARDLGVDTQLVKTRIAPPELFESSENVGAAPPTLELADRLSRIFGWSLSLLLGDEPLPSMPLQVDAVAFRLHRGANVQRVIAHTHYARYLAGLAVKASSGLPGHRIPADPAVFLRLLDDGYSGPDFRSVLRALWDHGVIVLPLDDPGGFQGAAWRIRGRNVAVLNTRSRFASRWCHDLLHETHHLTQTPDAPTLEVVDFDRDVRHIPDTPGEQQAEDYARHVELRGRAEDLTARAMRRAGRKVERLTRVVPLVAEEGNVDTGTLANYIAWRLSLEDPPFDWWGSASNLQVKSDPLALARDEFFQRVDVRRLTEGEQQVLIQGLAALGTRDE